MERLRRRRALGQRLRRRTLIARGEIRVVNLEPSRGSEASKTRPAIVVSNDPANESAAGLGRGCITIVPLTTSTENVYPFQTLIPAGRAGLDRDSKAQAEQVRAVDISKIGRSIASIPDDLMEQIDRALRIHLSL